MKRILIAGLALAAGACAQTPSGAAPSYDLLPSGLSVNEAAALNKSTCPPEGWDRAKLDALKAASFEIADANERAAFAIAITDCLAVADSALRDGIAYEALTHMLRAKQLDDATKRAVLANLMARLDSQEPFGVEQPFAALALSEVARADRIDAFLTEQERAGLLVKAQHWFINISDYRGFSEADGWRHAVAHGSDLLMQLALNPEIDEEGLKLIISAVGVQVAPTGHAYVHGESERLARPILFAASRGTMDEAAWTGWLAKLATPPDPDAVFSSEAGLVWRHDTMAFLQALYMNVVIGSDAGDDVLRPGLEAALKAMP